MIYRLLTILLICLACTAQEQNEGFVDPKDRNFPADYEDLTTNPEVSEGIQKYAPDDQPGPQSNFGLQPITDNELFWQVMVERLEYQWREEGKDIAVWDAKAWAGGDYNKLQIESEGEWNPTNDEVEHHKMELLYSRNISSFWDLQIGARYDLDPEPERAFGVIGVEGLAPQWWHTDFGIYISEDGDVSAILETEYDLRLTQRLFLQPRIATEISAQEVEEYDIGQGFTDIALELRLRYEISRKFAPYIGVSWKRSLGETADIVDDNSGDVEKIFFITGVRMWF